jgi:hypothetical protein
MFDVSSALPFFGLGFLAFFLILKFNKLTEATLILLIVYLTVIMSSLPKGEKFYTYKNYKIHSTADNYNSINGIFCLGTGNINSREMYAGNVFDGEMYERIYIPVATTKRKVIDYLTDTAIYKKPVCKRNSSWLFYDNNTFECENIKGILEIPKETIVKKLNFQ